MPEENEFSLEDVEKKVTRRIDNLAKGNQSLEEKINNLEKENNNLKSKINTSPNEDKIETYSSVLNEMKAMLANQNEEAAKREEEREEKINLKDSQKARDDALRKIQRISIKSEKVSEIINNESGEFNSIPENLGILLADSLDDTFTEKALKEAGSNAAFYNTLMAAYNNELINPSSSAFQKWVGKFLKKDSFSSENNEKEIPNFNSESQKSDENHDGLQEVCNYLIG